MRWKDLLLFSLSSNKNGGNAEKTLDPLGTQQGSIRFVPNANCKCEPQNDSQCVHNERTLTLHSKNANYHKKVIRKSANLADGGAIIRLRMTRKGLSSGR
jgi:hypothetical protein